ncbi:hypothetical protein Enr13x_26110 [Stieleria neptunia]|uniref:DUF3566 domain-containing protein n=1 Tax=Stieleria neptunia TaxID=2527979 RepID=A0A518HPK3_9BACT|nr:hypothetical protein [Stieleria neptunia]QDV42761.1 hypothetical protein Enr13x_26110 [Stieleria neptunia]
MATGNPYETPNVSHSITPSRRTVTVKRLDVMSCGVMLGVLYAIIGLFVGGLVTLMALGGMAAQGGDAMAGLIGGIGAIILMPLFYGFGGFIGGVIGALLYNLCATFVGGIKFDLE